MGISARLLCVCVVWACTVRRERERVSERDVLFGRRGGDDAARMHGK